MMTERANTSNPEPNLELVRRFAELVRLTSTQPTAAGEHREAARGVVKAVKRGGVRFGVGPEGLTVDDAALDDALLGERLSANGIEELGITERAALADLLDLARLLVATPTGSDPAAAFAARAAVLDAKAFPRKMRPRAPEPELKPVPEPEVPKKPKQPKRDSAAVRAAAAQSVEPAPREVPERLVQALPIPTPSHPALAAAIDRIDVARTPAELTAALAELVNVSDLAFRQGRFDDLIEAVTALVAIEFVELERDGADDRRQAFNHALRTLARPVLLRQLAVLRHERVADPVASGRLQQVLFRYGTDGAESLIVEYMAAATSEARATCIEALRGLRRTHDALLILARDTRDLVVRQAAVILGELRDEQGQSTLVELLQHPDERTRRAAVAALSAFGSETALEAIGSALDDEAASVRLRAVAALSDRRTARSLVLLTPLLDREPDREVLYAAIGALGEAGSSDAVQLLIRIAEGEGLHPLRKSAGMRIQACTALAAIRSPTAMAAVQMLRDDRDQAVREASVRLVAQARRRTTSASTPVVSAP